MCRSDSPQAMREQISFIISVVRIVGRPRRHPAWSSRNVLTADRSTCFANLAPGDLLPRILVGMFYSLLGIWFRGFGA